MKHLGIILIVLGALLLILSAAVPALSDLADNNIYTVGSLVMIIVGLIAHIFLNKKYVD